MTLLEMFEVKTPEYGDFWVRVLDYQGSALFTFGQRLSRENLIDLEVQHGAPLEEAKYTAHRLTMVDGRMWAQVFSVRALDGDWGFVPLQETVTITERQHEIMERFNWDIPSPGDLEPEDIMEMMPLVVYLLDQVDKYFPVDQADTIRAVLKGAK